MAPPLPALLLLLRAAAADPTGPARTLSPLCAILAHQTPDVGEVTSLLAAGADPNATCPVQKRVRRSLSFPEVLMGALIPPLGLMLVLDPGTTTRTRDVPVLTLAVGQRRVPIASALLEAGADPLSAPRSSDRALAAAVRADLDADDPAWTHLLLGERTIPDDALCSDTRLLDDLRTATPVRTRLEGAGMAPGGQDCEGATWLHRAARHGDVKAVAAIVSDAVVPVDLPDHQGRRAVVYAARGRHWDVVDHLLTAGARVHQPTDKHGTLLHEAVRQRRTGRVSGLLDAGHPVGGTDASGRTPLSLAVQDGTAGSVEALLTAGADPQADGRLLERAVKAGSAEKVSHLLAAGLSADAEVSFGRDLFDLAYAQDDLPVAEALAKGGGRPGRGRRGGAVFHEPDLLAQVLRSDQPAWEALLLSYSTPQDREDALFSVLFHERYAAAARLLEADTSGATTLAQLAALDKKAPADWLLAREVRYDTHALDILVPDAPLSEVRRALEHGASPEGSSPTGRLRPVERAHQERRPDLVALLLEAGAVAPESLWRDVVRGADLAYTESLLTAGLAVPLSAIDDAIRRGTDEPALCLLRHAQLADAELRALRRTAFWSGAPKSVRGALKTRLHGTGPAAASPPVERLEPLDL